MPALRALRESYPDARITLLSTAEADSFVQRFRCYLDDLLVYPGPPNRPDAAACLTDDDVSRFYTEAHARRFDAIIQLQDGAEAWNHIVARLGAAHWAGFVAENASATTLSALGRNNAHAVLLPWPGHLPEIQRYTALIQHLGIPVSSHTLDIPLADSDHQEAARLFQSAGLNPSQTIVLHPGAMRPEERWPAECYARLAQELVAHGWQIAITGREDDRPETQRVRAAMRNFAVDLTGATHSGSYAAMLAQCRLLVCNEPSVSHVALAVHTPSIVLASGSDRNRWVLPNPELHTVLWPHMPDTLQSQADQQSKGVPGRPADLIDVDRVLLHARHKLKTGANPA